MSDTYEKRKTLGDAASAFSAYGAHPVAASARAHATTTSDRFILASYISRSSFVELVKSSYPSFVTSSWSSMRTPPQSGR